MVHFKDSEGGRLSIVSNFWLPHTVGGCYLPPNGISLVHIRFVLTNDVGG